MERVKAGAVAVAFLLVGGWICLEAVQVPFGTLRMPGAGFFPLVLGVTLSVLALTLLGMSLLSPSIGPTRVWPDRPEVLYVMAILLVTVWLFDRAGFLITMALFLAVSTQVLGRRSWVMTVVVAVVGSVTAYWVFGRLLQISLPGGMLRF